MLCDRQFRYTLVLLYQCQDSQRPSKQEKLVLSVSRKFEISSGGWGGDEKEKTTALFFRTFDVF